MDSKQSRGLARSTQPPEGKWVSPNVVVFSQETLDKWEDRFSKIPADERRLHQISSEARNATEEKKEAKDPVAALAALATEKAEITRNIRLAKAHFKKLNQEPKTLFDALSQKIRCKQSACSWAIR